MSEKHQVISVISDAEFQAANKLQYASAAVRRVLNVMRLSGVVRLNRIERIEELSEKNLGPVVTADCQILDSQ